MTAEAMTDIHLDGLSVDDSFSETDTSCSGTLPPDTESRDEVQEVKGLTEKETRDVRVWRTLLLITIVVTGVTISTGAYFFLKKQQEEDYETNPAIFAGIVAASFFFVAIIFFVYDRFVQRRNNKVVGAAARSNAIVSSLFPSNVRDRIFASEEEENKSKHNKRYNKTVKSFLSDEGLIGGSMDDEMDDGMFKSKPIADLFPETTILFADIAGFTAWSSVREPSQVFMLLETLYRAFDNIAKKRRVFKVETVGDCYVAVTGLPDPRKDHAVAMCRFARDCMYKMSSLTKKLEVTLGPDTGDLSMRMGLHSGPVTAGVLRGERSRFQLFGDTMNTASRMETTGESGSIQLSQETADLLLAAGKGYWIEAREEKVIAKGKGELQTYWLVLGNQQSDGASFTSGNDASMGNDIEINVSFALEESEGHTSSHDLKVDNVLRLTSSKTTRLVEWNVEVLLGLLRQIVARRNVTSQKMLGSKGSVQKTLRQPRGTTTLDEVKEIITLPKFDARAAKQQEDPECIELPACVIDQVHDYVANIASMYRENPFHNFEHASHVTMSVVKLLSRIVAPSEIKYDETRKGRMSVASSLHDHTYGITSDPLTQFACVFSALIHDVDHAGVPNAQLVKEDSQIATFYKGKTVAEQNSVDLAWNLLMDSNYSDLRATIYSSESEYKRFRQLVVNSVMATDIVDKELKTLRNLRWDRAFSESSADIDSRNTVNRKATIVIEHLIQASDVAHTMQHWHIYRKWNERFFMECYNAYTAGRAEKDPTKDWYQGEIGFFDFYIIPLAKKLKNCGVFGVSSDEYLNYAVRNREEWEARGKEIVSEMVEKATGTKNGTSCLI